MCSYDKFLDYSWRCLWQRTFLPCCGLTPASPAPQSCTLKSLNTEVGERISRVKVRKPVVWGTDSLIGKAKAVHKQSKISKSLPISHGQQVFCHPQENGAPSNCNSDLGRQIPCVKLPPCLTSSPPLSFFSPKIYELHMTLYELGYPWDQLDQLVQLCPSHLLLYPQPPGWWNRVRSRTGHDSV